MKYRNTISGAIVNVKSKISGNWEPLEVPKTATIDEEKKAPKKTRGIKK